jgi:hypothetical protein
MAPTGIDINNRARVSKRAASRTCFSKRSSSRRSATRAASRLSTITSRLFDPRLEAHWRDWPDLEAKAAQNAPQAQLEILKLCLQQFACGKQRARLLRGHRLMQCTGRNQPNRINCAIPRASLRSLFTGIVLSAAHACRVSNNSTANPAWRSAA